MIKIVFYELKFTLLREALFIKKNKDRWNKIKKSPPTGADETARDFTKLVDDLAYAKTFYPTSKVTQLLNTLAAGIYLNIYRNRKEDSNRIVTFWKYDLPLVIRKHHGTILFSFIIFWTFFAVGFFSAKNEPGFVAEMLGSGYVEVTEENIANNNPFGIYQSGNSFIMWMHIMINNIQVSLIYFVKGLFFCFFTIHSLMKESMRLGAFEYMFFSKGLGFQSVLTVLIHGALELTAIIIASAAGIVLGKSVLFPGTVSRLESLKQGAKDGIKIVIGLFPVFIVAAFFEGYVTRHYKMGQPYLVALLILSLSFITWYFVIYPIRLRKKLNRSKEKV